MLPVKTAILLFVGVVAVYMDMANAASIVSHGDEILTVAPGGSVFRQYCALSGHTCSNHSVSQSPGYGPLSHTGLEMPLTAITVDPYDIRLYHAGLYDIRSPGDLNLSTELMQHRARGIATILLLSQLTRSQIYYPNEFTTVSGSITAGTVWSRGDGYPTGGIAYVGTRSIPARTVGVMYYWSSHLSGFTSGGNIWISTSTTTTCAQETIDLPHTHKIGYISCERHVNDTSDYFEIETSGYVYILAAFGVTPGAVTQRKVIFIPMLENFESIAQQTKVHEYRKMINDRVMSLPTREGLTIRTLRATAADYTNGYQLNANGTKNLAEQLRLYDIREQPLCL